MVSNQILQTTLEGLKSIARVEFGVLDPEGREVAATDSFADCVQEALQFAGSAADSQEIKGHQYFKIFDETQLEYILVAAGSGEDIHTVGKLAAFQIQGLLVAYKERFDKDNFIKNLLLDNLLLVDIYGRSKKLHIKSDSPRVVMVVQTGSRDGNLLDAARGYFGTGNKDFLTSVDENDVVVIKEISSIDAISEAQAAAEGLAAHLHKEGQEDFRIAYGTAVQEIKDVSRSYKEAKMAADVGKIFFDDKETICYSELGIGRLIYQLPIPLCKMFIKEIFGGNGVEDFDDETLPTVNKFFENSLNVSETSRQLFIHRNTLVYRLDKLEKMTGLDLRVFEDAITFKIALMVVKYMNYMEKHEY